VFGFLDEHVLTRSQLSDNFSTASNLRAFAPVCRLERTVGEWR